MADGNYLPAVRTHTMLPRDLSEARGIAKLIAESRLFGCKNEAEAFSLMLLADAEGLHPASAARDYHIIEGKPSLKADAMLARYMAAGGKVKWVAREPENVSAEFSHPSSGSVTITWNKERAITAGLWGKRNWKSHPIQMLSARVISEGVRASFPGVVSGLYTPEEVQDFDNRREPQQAQQAQQRHEPEPAIEGEVIDGEIVDENDAPPAEEAQPRGTKSNSRDLYARLQKGIRECQSRAELVRFGEEFKADFKKLPEDWYREIKAEYAKELDAFIQLEKSENERG